MKPSILTAVAAAGLAAAIVSGSARAEPEYVLKFGHLANEANVWNQAALKFAEEVKALSDGAIEVQVYPNEQLGKEMDLINGIQLGTVDMTITGESLQNWAPSAALLAVPYGVQNLEQLDAIAGGDIGQRIEDNVIEKTQLRPLAYFARGPRNLTSNRPIRTSTTSTASGSACPTFRCSSASGARSAPSRSRWRSRRCSRRCRAGRSTPRRTRSP